MFEFTDAHLRDLVRFDEKNQHFEAPVFVLETFF
jgi:hypothetical protein